jgi:hypothetical protein
VLICLELARIIKVSRATTISDVSFLTFTCAFAFADHNILFLKNFAADEAQSLAAIFRNEEGAIDGTLFSLH